MEMGGGDPTLIEKTIHAFALLQHPHPPLLEQGRRAVAGHLFGGAFSKDEARTAAAKAAFLAARLRTGTQAQLAGSFRYNPQQAGRLQAVQLADPVLQRLKGGNPEAFFYWKAVLETIALSGQK
jgi:hypothetical protein